MTRSKHELKGEGGDGEEGQLSPVVKCNPFVLQPPNSGNIYLLGVLT